MLTSFDLNQHGIFAGGFFDNLETGIWYFVIGTWEMRLHSGVTVRKSFVFGVAGGGIAEIARNRNVMACDRKAKAEQFCDPLLN